MHLFHVSLCVTTDSTLGYGLQIWAPRNCFMYTHKKVRVSDVRIGKKWFVNASIFFSQPLFSCFLEEWIALFVLSCAGEPREVAQ